MQEDGSFHSALLNSRNLGLFCFSSLWKDQDLDEEVKGKWIGAMEKGLELRTPCFVLDRLTHGKIHMISESIFPLGDSSFGILCWQAEKMNQRFLCF